MRNTLRVPEDDLRLPKDGLQKSEGNLGVPERCLRGPTDCPPFTPLTPELGRSFVGVALLFGIFILNELGGVTLPVKQRLQHLPNRAVIPVFTEDISRIGDTCNVMEANYLCGNRPSHAMEGEGVMALV